MADNSTDQPEGDDKPKRRGFRDALAAISQQYPLLQQGWVLVLVVCVVAGVGVFAKEFIGGLGKNAADRVVPTAHDEKKPAVGAAPSPASIELADFSLVDPRKYFSWTGHRFGSAELKGLKSYYDDEGWSQADPSDPSSMPPKLYESDDLCIRPSLKYFGSVALGLASANLKARLRKGDVPTFDRAGSPTGPDAQVWESLASEVDSALVGKTYTMDAIFGEAASLAKGGEKGIALSEKTGGASPTFQLILRNSGDTPDVVTSVAAYLVSAAGHTTVGGNEEFSAAPLNLVASINVRFDSHDDVSESPLDPPVVIPPHGFARLNVRIDPGSLYSKYLGSESSLKNKRPVAYGEDVTSMVFGGVEVRHGSGIPLRTPSVCVSYTVSS